MNLDGYTIHSLILTKYYRATSLYIYIIFEILFLATLLRYQLVYYLNLAIKAYGSQKIGDPYKCVRDYLSFL